MNWWIVIGALLAGVALFMFLLITVISRSERRRVEP